MKTFKFRPMLAMVTGLTVLVAGGARWPVHAAETILLAQAQDDVAAPDENGDQGALVVRLGRLENQIRALTGQIEQLQYQNKKLADDMRKMQGDVDFRFQDLQRTGGAPAGAAVRPLPQKRGDATEPDATTPVVAALDAPAASSNGATPAPRAARATGDVFDPDANPTAPGAPKPLGTTQPSAPISARASADPRPPLDLMQRPGSGTEQTASDTPRNDTPSIIAAPPAARALPDPNAVASLTPGGTREEFDNDLGLYKQGQFDGAATGFQGFVTKYPKDRLVPDAVYLAGESYSRLGRHREAAEQFLKLSTDYGKSARAPDALLRLGMSLNALGAKDQACATYLEVTRKYPTASAEVRAGVDRELKRSRCRTDG
ncbi:tol-pal system protein YbgF [Lichenihabitans sp. PAMC28606]|uniref:tol-pal system protein YbgF n=1 Tax=Lichenihabitans sp. PAMC28606 TaxID=2880932 RepID=UPI001D09E65A|nr:tol-pal system protein YbgF [Lichenihabitans sp. PAMC28606]UDL95930.1 tol-pal system protein YbgF [Lichenihabitans sp. PAMC28606]